MRTNPFTRIKAEPAFLSNASCRAIRAEFAKRERAELIAKYRALLADADAALREPRMAWLAERIRDSGGTRAYHLLVQQGHSRFQADNAVDTCGNLLGNRLFALSCLRRLGVKP